MTIFIGADHNGFRYKEDVKTYLRSLKMQIIDCGDEVLDPKDDFPIFAAKVCNAVLASHDKHAKGILVCGSGQGMVMAANRFKGIRAGLGYSTEAAKSIRNDEDSNVLSLPASTFKDGSWQSIIRVWLRTDFAKAERFIRRNAELDTIAENDMDWE